MKLKSIKLRNFRCFENLELDFHKQLTVISGGNASGKSAVLDAVAISVGTFPSSFDGMSNCEIRKEDVRLVITKEKGKEVVANAFGGSLNVNPMYPVVLSAAGIIDNQEVLDNQLSHWEQKLTGSSNAHAIVSAKEIISVADEYQRRIIEGDATITLPLIAYYNSERTWLPYYRKKKDPFLKTSRINGYIDCMNNATNNKLMIDWFKRETLKQLQKKSNNGSFEVVIKTIEKCFSILTKAKNVTVSYNFDNNDLDIQYRYRSKNIISSLSRISDGYKYAIGLIVNIAYRMAELNPQLRNKVLYTPGIVIIDAIELHLDVDLQMNILKILTDTFPNIQFIISTFSPLVIGSIESENLIILRK